MTDIRVVDEVWADIPTLEGRYQASTHGHIRSLDRTGATCYGSTRILKGKLIAQKAGVNGYMRISAGVHKTQFVHRLVAMTFIPNKNNLPVINHIDGNKKNNFIENLEWCTQRHNMQHAHRTGLSKGMPLKRGEESIAAKLSKEDVINIKTRLKNGDRSIDLSREYHVCKGTIGEIKAGRSWSSVCI